MRRTSHIFLVFEAIATMKVQLLILLALAGPFCGIARASPTGLPATTAPPHITTEVPVTGTPSTQPEVLPAEVSTKAASEPATEPATKAALESTTEAAPVGATGAATKSSTEAALEVTTGAATDSATEAVTAKAIVGDAFTTHAAVVSPVAASDSPAVSTQGVEPTQEVLKVDTAAPTDAMGTEKTDTMDGNVVVEDEGLSSGQVVGVVIGVLIALVIVIAVVIAFVRRMGKYSP